MHCEEKSKWRSRHTNYCLSRLDCILLGLCTESEQLQPLGLTGRLWARKILSLFMFGVFLVVKILKYLYWHQKNFFQKKIHRNLCTAGLDDNVIFYFIISSTFRRKKVELLSSRLRLGRLSFRLSFLSESISQKLTKVSIWNLQ